MNIYPNEIIEPYLNSLINQVINFSFHLRGLNSAKSWKTIFILEFEVKKGDRLRVQPKGVWVAG